MPRSRHNLAKGVCCLCERAVQGWPRCIALVLLSIAAAHIATGSQASFLRAAEKLPCLLIRSHVNRASPVSGSRYVCTGDLQQKMAYTIQCIPPLSIFVRGLCDLKKPLIVSSAKSEVQYTSWSGKCHPLVNLAPT